MRSEDLQTREQALSITETELRVFPWQAALSCV